MKKRLTTALFTASVLFSYPALAADKTIKLSVPGMTCASCPYIVEGAINMIDGIKSVETSLDDRSATVTYDDAITDVAEITEATNQAGYPSTLLDTGNAS